MKILIGNVKSTLVIGGKDHLIQGVDLEKELREYLRVRPDGYHHSRAFKMRKWDGWKNFITTKGDFATGFVPLVTQFAESLGAVVELVDQRPEVLTVASEIATDVRHHEMMEHQTRTVGKLGGNFRGLGWPRGVFYCSTNSGKTTMAAGVQLNLRKKRGAVKSLFIVHTKEIYAQAVEFFQGAGIPTGGINSGSYDTGGAITVGMVRTMENLLDAKDMTFLRDLAGFDVVFIDEGHHAGAPGYSKLLQAMTNASVRIVLSGTALENEDKVKNMTIVGLSGLVLARIKNVEMFDAGVSLKPCVKVVLNPRRQGKVMTYAEEQHALIHECEERMHAITQKMLETPGLYTVVTFEEIAHGKFMFEYLEQAFAWKTVEWTHGTDPHRTDKLRLFKEKKIDILIVSMILQEGVNLPGIQRMVLAQGGKSAIRLKQLSGRGMRKDKDDPDATTFEIIEVWDQGLYTEKHSRARMKIYLGEGFDVEYCFDHKRGKPAEAKK